MADILKVSTPLVDRNAAMHQGKQPPPSSDTQFQLNDITKVVKSNPQSELLQQNNGMPPREESPAILMNLLRDPSVTVSFLRNIYLLQEIVGLIPQNNEALTQEINQMFGDLMVSPDKIASELARQEGDATVFRGELFTLLRSVLQEGGGRPDLRFAVANLLKSLNATLSKEDILSSVGNNLIFVADQLSGSKTVHSKLLELADRFLSPDAAREFPQLKNQTMLLLRDVEHSILFTPKLERTIPLITYNLSRFSDNPDYLQDAANAMLKMIESDADKEKFMTGLRDFLQQAPIRRAMGSRYDVERSGSKVMDALVRLITKEATNEEITAATADKLERIIESLLSSPCNYTPLLHFIVPVDESNMHSFAEIWIDTMADEQEQQGGKDSEGNMHLLIVFDVEAVGQFEAELAVRGDKLVLNLLCPPQHVEAFLPLRDYAAKITAGTHYSLSDIYIGSMERPRSLMDVFKSLPRRRTGIDVKI